MTRLFALAAASLLVSTAAHAVDCTDPTPTAAKPPPPNPAISVTIDPATAWQPRGGQIRFIVESKTQSLAGYEISACFRWTGVDAAADRIAMPVQLVELTGGPTSGKGIYTVSVPRELEPVPSNWIDRALYTLFTVGRPVRTHFDNSLTVPMADLRVVVINPNPAAASPPPAPAAAAAPATLPPAVAAVAPPAATVAPGAAAAPPTVPPAAPPAAPAATAPRVAPPADVVQEVGITSIWGARLLAVLAAAAALALLYGWARLRHVPGGAPLLWLISTRRGYASLSQFQIMLWSFVFGAGAVYVMALSGSLIDIPASALVLLGITGGTTVVSKIQSNNVQARADAATVAPGPVTALMATGQTATSVTLGWTAPVVTPVATATALATGPVASYRVDYRPQGTAAWLTASAAVTATTYTLTSLQPGTLYDFQVAAVNAAGATTAVPPLTAATAAAVPMAAVAAAPAAPLRVPLWSDLVVTPSSPGEIDVTRVQMLFFTLISAGFVGLKLLDSYVIPDIPSGFMLLMGISNGVYLTSKFNSRD